MDSKFLDAHSLLAIRRLGTGVVWISNGFKVCQRDGEDNLLLPCFEVVIGDSSSKGEGTSHKDSEWEALQWEVFAMRSFWRAEECMQQSMVALQEKKLGRELAIQEARNSTLITIALVTILNALRSG
ncbi:unnamed protein product [Sphagnum tenellum]